MRLSLFGFQKDSPNGLDSIDGRSIDFIPEFLFHIIPAGSNGNLR
jgi:hypothetical protein